VSVGQIVIGSSSFIIVGVLRISMLFVAHARLKGEFILEEFAHRG